MAAISRKLRSYVSGDIRGLTYWCQGCNQVHGVRVEGPGAWSWNGNIERPTFTPSVLVTYPANPNASEELKEWRNERRCHTFITEGKVQFLGDCTHELAGQTLELPDLPDWLQGE